MGRLRWLRSFALAAVAVTLAAACGSSGSPAAAQSGGGSAGPPASQPSGSPITIGSVGTWSGFAGATSAGGKYALQAWASYTNAHGGIDGHPVNVIIKDDQGSATNALADAKELVSQDHVIAIVGQHESGLESTWASYVSSQNIPVIGGPASASDWLTNPDFFPVSTTPVNTLTLTAYTTILAGKTKFGVIYCAEVPGCAQVTTLMQGIAPKIHVDYTGAVAVSASAPNYTAQCVTLKNQGAEVVFTATDIGTTQRFIANCAQQGYKPIYVDNPQNWASSDTKSSVWQGTWLSTDSLGWLDTGQVAAAYKSAMAQYQPNADIQNTSATASWVAADTFAAALEKSGLTPTSAATSADVLNGLYALGPNFNLGGSIAPVTYTKGKPAAQQPCGWYLEISGGQATAPKGTNQICVSD